MALIAAAFVLYRCTPLAELATAERMERLAGSLQGAAWAPLAVVAVFVAAGAVEFPVVLLIGATATLFSPVVAALLSLAGGLASAAIYYWIGAKLAGERTREALGAAVGRVSGALDRGGVIAIVVMRSIPFAPFTVVNLACGALRIRFFPDYLAGTALGLAPGIVALTAFGHQLKTMWQNPSAPNIAKLAAIALAWILLIGLVQRAARRLRS